MRFLLRFLRSEDAATAVEYAVVLTLILMAIIGTIGMLGMQSGGMWAGILAKLREAGFFN